MLKTVTWISLGLSILGTLVEIGGSADQSNVETVAELAMVAKVLGGGDGFAAPSPADNGQPAQRR